MTTHQPVHGTIVGHGATTALIALLGPATVMAGVAALLLTFGAAGHKASAQTVESPAPAQAALPNVYTPSATAMRLLPGQPQWRQASARRASDGNFYFDTELNGTAIRMVFDTGATVVSLRAEDAAKAGIAVSTLNYSIATSTANGNTTVAPIMLDTLQVGGVTRRNVRAVVSRPGQLGVSLLGQSFMSKLAGYRFEHGELILQGE